MKKLFALLILTFILNNSFAQDAQILDSIDISIDWNNEINKNHKYKKAFSKKDKGYIKWIYEVSKNVSCYTSDKTNEKKYYHDGRGNNPLVFTIRENNHVRTEKYRNVVKPSKKYRSAFSINLPKFTEPQVEGSLPKGIITYFSDSSKGYEIGIETDNNSRKVKIEILSSANKLIHIIEDNVLEKGWNHYKWDITELKHGKYFLKYTVDDEVMIQEIMVKEYFSSTIGRFFNWLF